MSVFFSVIIPLYNKESYVGRAIDSVLFQKYKDFEVVVVNDGSTDFSASIAKRCKDPRVKVIDQENQGVGKARNTGMQFASGQWLAFLDADDMWSDEHLSELFDLIKEYERKGVGIVSTRSKEVLECGDTSFLLRVGSQDKTLINYFDLSSNDIGYVNSSTVAVSKAAYKNVGGFGNAKSGEDLEYWARVSLHYPLAISSRLTAIYFRGNGGNMETIAKKRKLVMPLPKSLSDVSPTVSMLSSRLDGIQADRVLYSSVVRYINSRVSGAMRGALVNNDVPRIKALRKLYLEPCTHESRPWWYLSALPAPMLSTVSLGRRVAKRLYHRLKR